MANDVGHVLGKKTDYKFTYDPGILAREPRVKNRQIYGFDNSSVPWNAGVDAWHAYEASFLTEKGLPVNGILKLIIPANSEFIVESKSLKLYLFSFNMQRIGTDIADASRKYVDIITKDLSALLNCNVIATLTLGKDAVFIDDIALSHAINLESLIDADTVEFTAYKENPALLTEDTSAKPGQFFIKTDVLRSACKITHQPDEGTLYIHIRGNTLPTLQSLLQYIVSIRDEYHFHEEIVEMVYSRLQERFLPDDLMVCALYTRRGGIDICPARASREDLLPLQLIDPAILTTKEYRS